MSLTSRELWQPTLSPVSYACEHLVLELQVTMSCVFSIPMVLDISDTVLIDTYRCFFLAV